MRAPAFFRRRGAPDISTMAAGLALGIAVGSLIVVGIRMNRSGRQRRESSERLDDSLQATYPASDPPASQYYDIPANRA